MEIRLRKNEVIHIAAAIFIIAALLAGGAYLKAQKKAPSGKGITITETVVT